MFKTLLLLSALLLFSSGCRTTEKNDDNVSAMTDENACQTDNIAWRSVSDIWGTPEGVFSDDLTFWVRSQIAEEDSRVTLSYLYAGDYRETEYKNYTALGTYEAGEGLRFDLQINQNYIGAADYFYVSIQGKCYRGEVPDSEVETPDKQLIEVMNP